MSGFVMDETLPDGASHESCAYCGARPTWPVVWTYGDGAEHVIYLCAECDEAEIKALEGNRT
jgi:hypothetical protein